MDDKIKALMEAHQKRVDSAIMNHPEKDKIDELFNQKGIGKAKIPCGFAILTKDIEVGIWNGNHPPEKNTRKEILKEGSKVTIWMVSRFGDAGITGQKNPYGYDARVMFDCLKDIKVLLE